MLSKFSASPRECISEDGDDYDNHDDYGEEDEDGHKTDECLTGCDHGYRGGGEICCGCCCGCCEGVAG